MESFLEKKNAKKLMRVLGFAKTLDFLKAFEGQVIYVPKVRNLQRIIRNYRILEGFQRGMSWDELRKRNGLSESQVRSIVKTWKEHNYKEEVSSWPE